MLVDEGFEYGGELFLLAAGKLRGRFKKSTHLVGGPCSAFLSLPNSAQHDEEFGDWIKDEFFGSPMGTEDEDALPPTPN